MNKLVSLLKSSIVKNDEMIETKRIETLNKVNEVCNSPEMKKVLKDTGFTIEKRDRLYNNHRDLDIKFNYGSDIEFEITHSSNFGNILNGFGVTDLDVNYKSRDNYKIEYNDKDADFAKLTKWYDIFNQYEKLINSNPINTIDSILNEYVEIHNGLVKENEFFAETIYTTNKKEISDTINDLLENGGELEYGIEKTCKYTLDDEGYILSEKRRFTRVEYKDENGDKCKAIIDSIVVGDKIKGKQSWKVELYRSDDNDINNSIHIDSGILTKNKLSDLIYDIVESNQLIDVRNKKEIIRYEEFTSKVK